MIILFMIKPLINFSNFMVYLIPVTSVQTVIEPITSKLLNR